MSAMKLFALVVVLSLALMACDDSSNTQAPAANEAVITGTVIDASLDPPTAVQGASVSGDGQTTTTDASGKFTLRFSGVTGPKEISLYFTKTGYRDTTVVVNVEPGQQVNPVINLTAISVITGGSRDPKTIAFLGASPREISVYGVGGIETSILGWEVRDSVGRPLDANSAVDLSFRLVNPPGGGEYVSPVTRRTDANGQAYMTFSSGTKSGVAQIVARTTVPGTSNVIESSPVRVIINGGFPVQARFSIAPERYNFAALNWLGRTLGITVLVGDIYSNPVAPGTAVYFRSEAGVIQPSVFTNTDGLGSVSLISGNPKPPTGYHWVVARTIAQDGSAVTDSIELLWSGYTIITPPVEATFNIANNTSQTFSFRVADALGHPLSAGTAISVTAAVPPPPDPNTPMNQVQVRFGVGGRVLFDDYKYAATGTTDFSFTLSDGTSNINQSTSVVVSISVNSSNGNAAYTFSGIMF